MSKADELRKKMSKNSQAVFTPTPRPSVTVNPLPQTPEESAVPQPAEAKPKASTPKAKPAKKLEQIEVVPLYAKIPKDIKRWLDHQRIDTGRESGEIITEALLLLKNKTGA